MSGTGSIELREILAAVRILSTDERKAYLDDVCADDSSLRAEVESLLRHNDPTSTIAFGLLVSVLSQSATQAITTALGITLAIDIFKGLFGDFSHYIYASFQPSLIDQSYLQDVSRIVRGYSDVLIDDRVQQLNMWVPIPALVIFLGLTLWLVQRRKI